MTAPQWLDADQQQAWRSHLEASRRILESVDLQLQREAGMPHAYYEILVRLSEAPGRAMRMSELARSSLSSKSRLSHAVARLEERGWVLRRACAEDRRGQIAVLTEKGFAALAEAAPGHVAQVRRVLVEALSPEDLRELRRLNERIIARLDDLESGCPAPPHEG
ncbi:MarR family winged helix-turn-helix transcriptional regulator [Allostreptomyces psammosilenae]|uniref:DNA-binding MarR family transcriptional regulator n=1 Tax=Allostreptomyces psammosilenae TaxID=1892865 RepID=A0A852ZUY1_9ACTN|nr:MarR family winged helix-turn-helix transcriptional regulator [Allostreptomyces psammosilenae]NYI05080.1 DNA-binding MarR family transcriptional regulator [Allostreptomyces psammosilenae]